MGYSTDFDVKNCGEGIIAITAPMKEQIYLVQGETSALLIDTGMGIGSLKAVFDKLTDLPVTVINTHGHPDHAGGNGEFGFVYLHPADLRLYEKMCSVEFRAGDVQKIFGKRVPQFENAMIPFAQNTRPVLDGQEFDLGGRTVRVYRVPGHTKGSVMLHDDKTKALFTGDTVSANETWLYQDYCTSLQTYYSGLRDFMEKCGEITSLYPGHLPTPITAAMLEKMIICVRRILLHDGKGEPFQTFAGSGLRYERFDAKIIYNPENLYEI